MRRSLLLCPIFAILGAAILASAALAAPPKVDYLFPAGGQQGQTVTVTASGTFGAWPVKTWVDREGLTVEATEKKGELKVTIAPTAAGVYWLRLYDVEGASSPRPFVVGALPEVNDAEPNDDPQKPQTLEGSVTVNGKLSKRGDVDSYAVQLKEGQTLVASLMANEVLGSPMDGVLQVCNARGDVFAQNDDERGLDSFLTFTAPRDGAYLVRTFAFPATPDSSISFAGAETYVYRLTITTGPYLDYTFPLAAHADESTELRLFGWNIPSELTTMPAPPGGEQESLVISLSEGAGVVELPVQRRPLIVATDENSDKAPQIVALPAVISGRIESPRDQDAFRFPAVKGQKVSLRVESRSLGFPLDPLLIVTDSEGKVLAEADDAGNQRDPTVSFAPPADGEYVAIVRDVHHHGGPRYAYRLTIEPETPDFRLTLAADAFVATPGQSLEIPVTVERRNGFKGEVEVTAEGLPSGLTASTVKSLPEGETAKEVKLVLSAEAGASAGPFVIVGKSGDGDSLRRVATFAPSGLNAKHTQAWVTVAEAK